METKKSEIKKIKISNKLMDKLVDYLFHEKNIEFKVPITKKTAKEWFQAYNKTLNSIGPMEIPYIALVSNNSLNELKTTINSIVVGEKITNKNIDLKTRFYYKLNNIYTFYS